MKGYAYLSLENTPHYRPYESLVDDPGFFIRNKHLILKQWFFDTENEKTKYYDMLYSMVNEWKVDSTGMRNFLASIGDLRVTAPPPLPKNQISVSKSNED